MLEAGAEIGAGDIEAVSFGNAVDALGGIGDDGEGAEILVVTLRGDIRRSCYCPGSRR